MGQNTENPFALGLLCTQDFPYKDLFMYLNWTEAMTAHRRTHLIVQRQTQDWAGQGYKNRTAAECFVAANTKAVNQSAEAEADIAGVAARASQREAKIKHTAELLDFWDATFKISFAECRRRLKEIAHTSWASVLDCDRIYLDWEDPSILRHTSDPDCIILFTDDDDWYAPDVFQRLESVKLDGQSGWVWNRTRYRGELLTSPLGVPILAFTNNYALLGQALDGTTRLADAMQHSTTDQWLREGRLKVAMMEGSCLSMTNKTPCSLTTLQKADRSVCKRTSLVDYIDGYAEADPIVNPSLEWARSFMDQTKSLFLEVRASLS